MGSMRRVGIILVLTGLLLAALGLRVLAAPPVLKVPRVRGVFAFTSEDAWLGLDFFFHRRVPWQHPPDRRVTLRAADGTTLAGSLRWERPGGWWGPVRGWVAFDLNRLGLEVGATAVFTHLEVAGAGSVPVDLTVVRAGGEVDVPTSCPWREGGERHLVVRVHGPRVPDALLLPTASGTTWVAVGGLRDLRLELDEEAPGQVFVMRPASRIDDRVLAWGVICTEWLHAGRPFAELPVR